MQGTLLRAAREGAAGSMRAATTTRRPATVLVEAATCSGVVGGPLLAADIAPLLTPHLQGCSSFSPFLLSSLYAGVVHALALYELLQRMS